LVAAVGFTICLPVLIPKGQAVDPFFPPDVFDDFAVNWYVPHLKAMKEPSLWTLSRKDPTAAVYRFLWLPTFHRPVSVRIVRSSDSAVLHIVKLDGRGGYEPGGISVLKSKKLTRKQWDEFKRRLDQANFWFMPTEEVEDSGTGGDRLIFEGVLDGNYHVVHRESPDPGSDYVEVCRFVLDQSGLNLMRIWEEYH
jgi:hypothetical protein